MNFALRAFCCTACLVFFLVPTLIAPTTVAADQGTANPPASPDQPAIEIPSPIHSFGETMEGGEVVHDFLVKNTGTGVLNIDKVKTG